MIYVIDNNRGEKVATVLIEKIKGDFCSGKIMKHSFTKAQIDTIIEHEEMINNQVFSLSDEMENKINSLEFSLRDSHQKIYDLQIWNLKEISFRIENV